MGILLSGRKLAKSFGPRPLFEDLTFGLFENERTGLIGPNGTGKSTPVENSSGAGNARRWRVIDSPWTESEVPGSTRLF